MVGREPWGDLALDGQELRAKRMACVWMMDRPITHARGLRVARIRWEDRGIGADRGGSRCKIH